MRILLVMDFSSGCDRAVADLAGQARPAGTLVRVLSIVERIPPSAAELWFDAEGSLQAVSAARVERAEELVLTAAAALRKSGLTVETAVRTGRRRKAIAREARSWLADLVVDC